jgi:hypothetical protein
MEIVTLPKKRPTFRNKKQLCEYLETEGLAIVEW